MFSVKPWHWVEPDSFPPGVNVDPNDKAQCEAIVRLYINATAAVPELARLYSVPQYHDLSDLALYIKDKCDSATVAVAESVRKFAHIIDARGIQSPGWGD